MREMLNKYFFLISCLLVGFGLVAQEDEPPCPVCPPSPPGLPIDNGLMMLMMLCFLFGFYKIYISVVKKKRSI